MESEVFFDSAGVRCAADLYLPEGLGAGDSRPGIVLGHGFTVEKTQLVDQGRAFARAGFVTLAIDYRYWGRSEGEPRRKNFPLEKAEDYRNAITYLQTRPEVDPDRIGIWGTSFSGGTVIYVAAHDRRVKATVSQVPVADGRKWLQIMRNPSQWDALLVAIEEDRKRRWRGEPGHSIAGTGTSGEVAVLPWKSARDRSMAPPDEMTLESVEKVIEWRPLAFIDLIAPRALMVITSSQYDVIHPYQMALDIYERASEPKQLVALPFDGMAFYGQPCLDVALHAAIEFYAYHLGHTVAQQQQRLLAEARGLVEAAPG